MTSRVDEQISAHRAERSQVGGAVEQLRLRRHDDSDWVRVMPRW